MINTKFVNVETIMEKVRKKLPPTTEINIDDIVEDIWEALSLIGAVQTYITLYSIVSVDNYRAKLPEWLHKLNEVRFLTTDTLDNITDEQLAQLNTSAFQMTTVLDTFDSSSNHDNIGNSMGYRYVLKNGYIHTTFEKGIIEISYDAMPMDTDMTPLVPDNVHYINAVMWFIVKSYLWKLMVRDVKYQTLFDYADSQWNFYVNSAATKAKIPGKDGLQALMNKFLRIVPNLHRNANSAYYRYPNTTSAQLDASYASQSNI